MTIRSIDDDVQMNRVRFGIGGDHLARVDWLDPDHDVLIHTSDGDLRLTWGTAVSLAKAMGVATADGLSPLDEPTCCLCGQAVTPADMQLRCPRALGQRGTHEVLNAPPWREGDPVRPGHGIHASGCERAMDPSVYRDPPCTCHCAEELSKVSDAD